MSGLLYLGGFLVATWLVIVGSVGLVRWQSYRASIRSEESDAERQARIRKMLDLPDEGEGGQAGYWRTD
ncbi:MULTISPECIES: hypothetical protein [Actinomadura]|uniref:Uncharacterized protein n=1 Tax=Actinomadura madurae TaxID=1993 RepID=A0A1I5WXI7_9ACTN|nr:hypothetical protein [Actinomadura madurae]SFQ24341.1 hypothetical protein SAMN04489713_12513 [Actinomadura madurae]SPT60697.1 Uncharacterised protein [Actinomadura madurae]